MYKEISQKYYKNTQELLNTIYHLRNRKGIYSEKDYVSNNKILSSIESADIVKEDFIEYIGILYLSHLKFNEKDILKLYGYKNQKEKDDFIKDKVLKNYDLLEYSEELNNFIISSIFIANYSTLEHDCFDSDFKTLRINGKNYDIQKWRIYKTEKEETTLPLRNLLSALFEKDKLDYCDIRKFYDSDISRSEKAKSDLIYTHKKKIEKKISPSLESLLNYKITILGDSSKSKEFSLVLER